MLDELDGLDATWSRCSGAHALSRRSPSSQRYPAKRRSHGGIEVAGVLPPRGHALQQIGSGRAAIEAVWAARLEAAALRRGEQRRRRARDRSEAAQAGPVDPRHGAQQAPGVRVLRVAEELRLRRLPRRRCPAYITTTRSARSATTPMSCVIRMIDEPWSRSKPLHQLQDLRLDRDVERGRRLVRDQERRVAGERHRDHHPLAHPARELMRVVVGAAFRVRDADLARAARQCAFAPAVGSVARARGAAPRSASRPCRPASARSSGPGRSSRSRARARSASHAA